jgi:hypothetical protein
VTATEVRPTAVRMQPNVFTWYFVFTRSTATTCSPVEPYALALGRARDGKKMGGSGGLETRNSATNETGRRHLGVALSVMKYTWDGHSDQKSSDAV